MKNHMFLQACLIVSGAVVIGAAPKEPALLSAVSQKADKKDWQQLFNGQDLTGWRTYQNKVSGSWSVVDGTLYCKGNKDGNKQHADLVTNEQFANFELSLQWKIAPGANSGIVYLVSEANPASYHSGPEYQLIDDTGYPDKLEPWQKTAANYAMDAPMVDATKPAGEWNHTQIIVNYGRVEHWLNGKKVVEYIIGSESWKQHKANSKWKDVAAYGNTSTGHIALQDHGGEAWFKEIKIKKL